jgi:hypothetical protein
MRVEESLLERIDRVAGEGGRTAWILEACRARLGDGPAAAAAPRVLRDVPVRPIGRVSEKPRVLLPVEVAVRDSVRRDVEPIVKGGK